MREARNREHEIFAMLKDALVFVGCPECTILKERMVSDKDGHRICPDIIVSNIRTGGPIAVFEIKAREESGQATFVAARHEMEHFLDRCPCYVVTSVKCGDFVVASVFSKDAEFPTWVPLSDKVQFKAMFGDYRDATSYAYTVAQNYSKGIRAGASNTARTAFLWLTIGLVLTLGTIECFGVVFSTGLYNLTTLLVMCTAGANGLSVHLKTDNLELSVHPSKEGVNN